MIAIAGPKGGCGKTTTALGLAEMFGQSGVPTLVVDGDRQLPNLHLAAGVGREPTIGSLSVGSTLTDHTQQHPDQEKVRILSAPKPNEDVDFKSALKKLNDDSIQILIDCPAGAGPDAIEPIVASDQVIVVTTNTKQSFDAAQKTINTAQRVGVPVEALIINKCDRVSGSLPIDAKIPLVQTVPERPAETPRKEPDVQAAHNEIVAKLLNERFATGIPSLDTTIGGGIHAGSVIGVTATPDSRSELILHALTATDRHTVYITTERSTEIILNQLRNSELTSSSSLAGLKHIDDVIEISTNNPLEALEAQIKSLPRKSNLIIDSMDRLEQFDKETYISFMNSLHKYIGETGSIAMLHMLDRIETLPNRSITKQFVDILLELEAVDTNSTQQWQLSIATSRIDEIPKQQMLLDLC